MRRFLFAVALILVTVAAAEAQPLTITVTSQCTASIRVDASTKPDSRSWTVEFLVNGGVYSRDSSAPYTANATGPAAVYEVGARWVRTGEVARPLPGYTVTCHGPVVAPKPADCIGQFEKDRDISTLECQANNTQEVVELWKFVVKVPAVGSGQCVNEGKTEERRRTQPCTFVPPVVPPTKTIFGVVDPTILGTCTAAVHDKHVVDIGHPTKLFRTWHPQTDPTGCVYGHEHGDNPAWMTDAEIAAAPVAFGVVGESHKTPTEPNGHEEAHEGFKVFIAVPGDVNDEGRINRVFSRSVFHMGTGGPRRFTLQHHSAMIRLRHPEFGLKAFTQLMMDTGGTGAVCDPRIQAPVKDVMNLNNPCKLGSSYEIWSTQQSVRYGGREVYRSFATPAVFDPITVFDKANPTAVVYAWDPRMAASKLFNDDWSGFRGCDRESYAQPGYWYNAGGRLQYWTDAMGNEVAAGAPGALLQEISLSNSVGAPATRDGLVQFKMRRWNCQQRGALGLKN